LYEPRESITASLTAAAAPAAMAALLTINGFDFVSKKTPTLA